MVVAIVDLEPMAPFSAVPIDPMFADKHTMMWPPWFQDAKYVLFGWKSAATLVRMRNIRV
jgi:hypothetical protein